MAKSLNEVLRDCPMDETIGNNFIKAWNIINKPEHDKILCTISGGSDSDIVMDICMKCDPERKIDYIWFDTGLEYRATKRHLLYLEKRYSIQIVRLKPKKSIPQCCRTYGQPFLSKRVSDYISRLQSHNFRWEDKTFSELSAMYPKCTTALKWWCNDWGDQSRFNISTNKWLKEYMIAEPPTFKISDKCCKYAKKDVLRQTIKDGSYSLNIYGVRKAEGGSRATAYKTCYSENDSYDSYRPVWFYRNKTKRKYDNHYNIIHSDCYSIYGLKRTGCAGCPFSRDFEQELMIIHKFEPNLFKAVIKIFGQSYEYTRNYRKFYHAMNMKR